MFLRPQPILLNIRLKIPPNIGAVNRYPNNSTNDDTREHNPQLTEVKPVDPNINQRKRLEERIINPIDSRRVNIRKQNRRILKHDLNRLDERLRSNMIERRSPLVDFTLTLQVCATRQCSESFRASEQDIGAGGLGHHDEHEEEDGAGHPENFPERPAPVFGDDAEAGEDGAECWGAEGGGDPGCEGVGEFEEAVELGGC